MGRYDGIADWYDTDFLGEVHAPEQATVIRLLGRGPGRLLDRGCGTGAKTVAFRDAGWDVTGVAISGAMLRLARGSFVQSFVDAGLTLERLEELGLDNRPFPFAVALRSRR